MANPATSEMILLSERDREKKPIDIYIVGLGILRGHQVTREVDEAIRCCKEVLYIDRSAEMDAYLRERCPRVTDLHPLSYREGENRLNAYDTMASKVVEAALDHPPVAFGLYGHPLIYAFPPFQVSQAAQLLDLRVKILPGISALDCLLVDLMLDPAHEGLQMYEATDLLIRHRPLQPDVPSLIWQIGAVETALYSELPNSPGRFETLKEYLLKFYPAEHAVVAVYSSDDVQRETSFVKFVLGEMESRAAELHQGMTLYIPPVEHRPVFDEGLVERAMTVEHLRELTAAPSESPATSSTAVAPRRPPMKVTREETDAGLPLVAYALDDAVSMPLVPADSRRRWMDGTGRRFANRCLPLVIANQAGWCLLSSHRLRVEWTGGDDIDSLRVEILSGDPPAPAVSHFGHGILTWMVPYLFRTPVGYNLLVRGPSNHPKDGVYPLEGIVETDSWGATFTMNWKMTRPVHRVTFEVGEPIAMIVPQRRGDLEALSPEIRPIQTAPELRYSLEHWSSLRQAFNADLLSPGSEAQRQGWQRHYFLGRKPDGAAIPVHQTKLRLTPFGAPPDPGGE